MSKKTRISSQNKRVLTVELVVKGMVQFLGLLLGGHAEVIRVQRLHTVGVRGLERGGC